MDHDHNNTAKEINLFYTDVTHVLSLEQPPPQTPPPPPPQKNPKLQNTQAFGKWCCNGSMQLFNVYQTLI